MPRPQNLEARAKILDAAYRLFHEHGYRGVSMDDVADKSGYKKANLFHYYPTKDALGLAVLERACAGGREGIKKQFANGADPIKTVAAMYSKFARGMEEGGCYKGCFIGNIAQELSDENEKMRLKVSEHLLFWTAELAGFLERHKEKGYFRKQLDARQSAKALVSLLEGATLMCKAEKKAEALKHAGAMAQTYLKALKA
jgi:TetR/AcrR family transcriptional repressor of nem operon